MKILRAINDLDKLKRDRMLLIGEAAYYEAMGESIVIDEALSPASRAEQEKRRTRDPWEDILENIPNNLIDEKGRQPHHPPVWRHRHDRKRRLAHSHAARAGGQQTRADTMRLLNVMKHCGWRRHDGGKVQVAGEQVRGSAPTARQT